MARFTETVVFPTPPLPDPTAIKFFTPAIGNFGASACGPITSDRSTGSGACYLSLGLHFLHLSLQPPHSAQPAIIIGSLALEVILHFRMRQNQKLLGINPLDHGIGNLFRLQRSSHQKISR